MTRSLHGKQNSNNDNTGNLKIPLGLDPFGRYLSNGAPVPADLMPQFPLDGDDPCAAISFRGGHETGDLVIRDIIKGARCGAMNKQFPVCQFE